VKEESIESIDTVVLKYIEKHEGSTVSEIYEGMLKKGSTISLNSARRVMRKLYRERKVTRTGVHAFKYKLKK
jgi:Fe2+ or Zn2+ uptake regulation protein